MRIKESAENYLEAILVIKNKKGSVRSVDIAHELNFTKPSVSVAMKGFREEGYITVDENGLIINSTEHDVINNYDMNSKEQSKEFVDTLKNRESFVQEYLEEC